VRFCITWEEIEHEGPGIYDEAYLANLRKKILAAEKDLSVYIEPHQDTCGAPAWTMEKLGINADMAGSAVTNQRYIAATMSTLFFAGKTYAPDLHIDGENIQDWLQNRCIAAFRHAKRRLKNCANLRWGTMNEPNEGFIGCGNLETGQQPSPWDLIKAASVFNEGYSCPWKQAGVWQDEGGEPKLLRSDYFSKFQGRDVVFTDDFLKPFIEKFISAMESRT
jgi:hypothetical protein